MFEADIDLGPAKAALARIQSATGNLTPLYRALAGTLEAETEANFEAQGRPNWVPLRPSTLAGRLKRNKGSSVLKILQDRGILAASVSSEFGSDFALIGAGGAAKAYAAIQQYGGTISFSARSTSVKLRTDRKGNLLRQGDTGSAKGRAVFAKDSHRNVRRTTHQVDAHSVTLPSRPYLPFTGEPGSGKLQPEAEVSVLATITAFLDRAIG